MSFMRSIRWQLPLSYAGIAFITAAILGLILVAILENYYEQAERENLDKNARMISQLLAQNNTPIMPYINYSELTSIARAMDVQLELLDITKNTVYNSGIDDSLMFYVSPNNLSETITLSATIPDGSFNIIQVEPTTNTLMAAESAASLDLIAVAEAPQLEMVLIPELIEVPHKEEIPVPVPVPVLLPDPTPMPREWFFYTETIPFNRTLLGMSAINAQQLDEPQQVRQRSELSVTTPIFKNNALLGYVQISNNVSTGSEIIATVRESWLVSGLIAALIAGTIGVLMSYHFVAPLSSLTNAVTALKQGNLSVRTRTGLKRRDEFGVLSDSFNEMAARIETTVTTLHDFVADAAHEIHTPLTAIRTNLELFLEKPNTASVYRALRQVDRLEHMTDNMLDLSRLEGNTAPNNAQLVNLNQIVNRLGEIYASRAEQADLDFNLSLPNESPLYVVGDNVQIQRVLMNLLDNAIKFTKAGKIDLSLKQHNQQAIISIKDTGIGIPEGDLPHLFKRFKRGRNTSNYEGNGLGLAIASAIIKHHRGKIHVESKHGQTCFTVMLPLRAR